MSNNAIKASGSPKDKIKVMLAGLSLFAGIFAFYFFSNKSLLVKTGSLIAGLVLAVTLLSMSMIGSVFFAFAKESFREAKKVVWPSRKEAMSVSLVVFGFVLLMAIYLWGVDKFLEFLLYDVILGWKR